MLHGSLKVLHGKRQSVPLLLCATVSLAASRHERINPVDRRLFLQATAMAGLYTLAPGTGSAAQDTAGKTKHFISIRTHETKGLLPHVWEECVGSDRAAVALREQWLTDLELMTKEVGMKSVRFHGLFKR